MSNENRLKGLYVISDDTLTPKNEIYDKIKLSLEGGAKIVQLRDKFSSDEELIDLINELQSLCNEYDATFILNDRIELAKQTKCDGLHIGKSDHHLIESIRKDFEGIIGVSCYGDIILAKEMENKGADYVAFGSFYTSPTKPNSSIISLDVLQLAKESLNIPICAIGGINKTNLKDILKYHPNMVAVISDIWNGDILSNSIFYAKEF